MEEIVMPGKFEVYLDKAGEHRFRLKAANGQNILSSEGYNSKASCMNGVESVGDQWSDGRHQPELCVRVGLQ